MTINWDDSIFADPARVIAAEAWLQAEALPVWYDLQIVLPGQAPFPSPIPVLLVTAVRHPELPDWVKQRHQALRLIDVDHTWMLLNNPTTSRLALIYELRFCDAGPEIKLLLPLPQFDLAIEGMLKARIFGIYFTPQGQFPSLHDTSTFLENVILVDADPDGLLAVLRVFKDD